MRSGALVVSTVMGVLMVVLAAVRSHGAAVGLVALALIAVGLGAGYRPAATGAVLLCAATILVSDPPLVFTAWCGLCAAGYLVCRHAVGTPEGAVMWSWPTAFGAVGFTAAGLVAAAFPLQLPWLPLAAPVAALAAYLVATRPFVS
jgi:hypothetical protein